jgi:hypothetical protein
MLLTVKRRHDNAELHAAACTCALLEQFNWEIFEHPPYSSDLAPSDYHVSPPQEISGQLA